VKTVDAVCDEMETMLLLNSSSNSYVWNNDEGFTHRFLQADNSTDSTGTQQSDSNVLKSTFSVYGSILLASFLLFCYVRRRFPRPYNIRNWVDSIKVRLKNDTLYCQYFLLKSVKYDSLTL
jgi:hypothetical protein